MLDVSVIEIISIYCWRNLDMHISLLWKNIPLISQFQCSDFKIKDMKWSRLNSKIYRPPKSKPTGNNTINLIVRFEFSSKLLQNKNCDKNYLLVFYQVFLYVYFLEDM